MNDQFTFHSLSRDVPPGKGVEEYTSTTYTLSQFKDWRRKLTDGYPHGMIVDGIHYKSVHDYIRKGGDLLTGRINKFSEGEMKEIILATGDARLYCKERGYPGHFDLEIVREKIKINPSYA